MPFGDRTGPAGLGPGTGRGLGFCSGFPGPGFMNRPGCGCLGRGGGRGWRNWFYATGLTGWQRAMLGWPWPGAGSPAAPIGREAELQTLKQQAGFLESALENIRKRVEELEGKSKSE